MRHPRLIGIAGLAIAAVAAAAFAQSTVTPLPEQAPAPHRKDFPASLVGGMVIVVIAGVWALRRQAHR